MSLAHVVKMYLKGEKVMGERIKKQSSIGGNAVYKRQLFEALFSTIRLLF